jgi:hypothetical protein
MTQSEELQWLRKNGFREEAYRLWREIEAKRARREG